ncbi:MAG: class B sortase [Oscillospiraceae bacterium]|nr:class B sortase [Oscillospiraceae bacterium]
MKQKQKIFKYIRFIILIASIAVFIYGAYNLIRIFLDYRAIDNLTSEMQERYTSVVQSNHVETIPEHLIIDWDALLNRNRDVVAWIYLPGTNINHVVLQGETNDTYLRHTIDREFSPAGSLFIESGNDPLFRDLNTIIHGHNMRNNSMFSAINHLAEGRIPVPSHVQLYLPDGRLKLYRIVSISQTNVVSALFSGNPLTIEDFFTLMDQGRTFSAEFDRENVEHLLTLSTCGNFVTATPSRTVLYSVLERVYNI